MIEEILAALSEISEEAFEFTEETEKIGDLSNLDKPISDELRMPVNIDNVQNEVPDSLDESLADAQEGLSDNEKNDIKEKSGYSDEIVDNIDSREEAEIYMDIGLQEGNVNGKSCLERTDINPEQLDEDGISNLERMDRGRPPITPNGELVELHHIGQKPDSPLAELTTNEHRGPGNDTVLHDKTIESQIDRQAFAKERKLYWKSKAEQYKKGL